jgi:hypothetical protein
MAGEQTTARTEAIEQFNRLASRADGDKVVVSLDAGLSMLRDLFYGRIHFDVERVIGADSMLIPLSESQTQRATKLQIETFQVVESAWMVREGQYVPAPGAYQAWLAAFRLGEAAADEKTAKRIAAYEASTPDGRRRDLMDRLMKVLPESRGAPLVLFRLVSLAIHIVTALAFGDRQRAAEVRKRQASLLSSITDCTTCRGAVLDNGETCQACSNPVWRYEWLTATD